MCHAPVPDVGSQHILPHRWLGTLCHRSLWCYVKTEFQHHSVCKSQHPVCPVRKCRDNHLHGLFLVYEQAVDVGRSIQGSHPRFCSLTAMTFGRPIPLSPRYPALSRSSPALPDRFLTRSEGISHLRLTVLGNLRCRLRPWIGFGAFMSL